MTAHRRMAGTVAVAAAPRMIWGTSLVLMLAFIFMCQGGFMFASSDSERVLSVHYICMSIAWPVRRTGPSPCKLSWPHSLQAQLRIPFDMSDSGRTWVCADTDDRSFAGAILTSLVQGRLRPHNTQHDYGLCTCTCSISLLHEQAYSLAVRRCTEPLCSTPTIPGTCSTPLFHGHCVPCTWPEGVYLATG